MRFIFLWHQGKIINLMGSDPQTIHCYATNHLRSDPFFVEQGTKLETMDKDRP